MYARRGVERGNLVTAMKRLLAAAFVFCVLPGCAYLSQFLSASGFSQPSFNFKNLALENASFQGITLDTIWKLDNPNPIGLSLASIDYNLTVEDKQVVSGKPRQGLEMKANGSSDLHFPAGIKFQDLAQVVQTFLTKDNAKWGASGSLGIQTPIGVINFPLAKTGTFEVPKLPAISFGNPKVSNLNLSGATLEFPLNVTNKNSYALPLTISGDLTLAGAKIGTISTGNMGALAGKGEKTMAMPLTVNFISAASAAVKIAQGGQAQVAFNANVESGGLKLPLNVNQLVNIVK